MPPTTGQILGAGAFPIRHPLTAMGVADAAGGAHPHEIIVHSPPDPKWSRPSRMRLRSPRGSQRPAPNRSALPLRTRRSMPGTRRFRTGTASSFVVELRCVNGAEQDVELDDAQRIGGSEDDAPGRGSRRGRRISWPHVRSVVPVTINPSEQSARGKSDGLNTWTRRPSCSRRQSSLTTSPTAISRNCTKNQSARNQRNGMMLKTIGSVPRLSAQVSRQVHDSRRSNAQANRSCAASRWTAS